MHNLVERLQESSKEDMVLWLHSNLLTASYVKAMPKDRSCKRKPVCRFSLTRDCSYPLIPCSERQEELLRHDADFHKLLTALGLYNCRDTNGGCPSYIPCISPKLSAGQLLEMAEQLHPVDEC